MEIGIIALIVFVSLFAIWLIFYFIPVGLWFSALVSGVRISLLQLILMRWRKVPPSTIVSSMIESTKAGLELNPNELEAHYLAGGNVTNVVHALVSAQKANIMLDFKMATAIDLAGRDVFEAVQMSVNPKVINTPPVAAVAKDGIQLIAKARVTVRANIKQLVGGAGEETVLARVGEGIVSSIGSAQSHKIVLENPDSISRVVLEKGLDAGTAFEILSIDIADIDVGKNIGAQLQMDQAEADKNIAQAKAERGATATINARFGLSQTGEEFRTAYSNLLDQEVIGLQFSIPLFDWGMGKGRVRMAKARADMVRNQIEQDETDYRHTIYTLIEQFHNQRNQCVVAARAREVAESRYAMAMENFRRGTVSVTDMNTAQTEKDQASQTYVSALADFWSYYYSLRRKTLYDFISHTDISVEFDRLIEE